MGLPPTQADTPYVAESQVLERAVAAFEDAWLAGRPPSLDAFLDSFPRRAARFHPPRSRSHRPRTAPRRRRNAPRRTLPDALPRPGPRRDDLLALIQWEYRLRKVHEPDLGFDEYRARFPDLGSDLSLWLARACCDAATVATPSFPPLVRRRRLGSRLPRVRGARARRNGRRLQGPAPRATTDRRAEGDSRRADAHPAAQRRFAREIQATTRLDHPNIVRVYDGAQTGDLCYLAMEYLDGDTLQHVVEHHGRLAVWEACELIRQAALGAAPRARVLLWFTATSSRRTCSFRARGESGAAGTLKILDLGLVRIDGDGRAIRTSARSRKPGMLMGTIDFIAPEQALNPHLADPRRSLQPRLHLLLPVARARAVPGRVDGGEARQAPLGHAALGGPAPHGSAAGRRSGGRSVARRKTPRSATRPLRRSRRRWHRCARAAACAAARAAQAERWFAPRPRLLRCMLRPPPREPMRDRSACCTIHRPHGRGVWRGGHRGRFADHLGQPRSLAPRVGCGRHEAAAPAPRAHG